MQEGIGRGGYRVLAIVFFAVGALGLAMAALAGDPAGSDWLGFGMAAVALAAVTGLMLATLGGLPASSSGSRPRPQPSDPGGAPVEPTELPTPEPPVAVDPATDIGFEYEPGTPVPAAPVIAAPERIQPPPKPVVQPRRTVDSKGWPDVKPAGVTRRQLHERNLPRDPGPAIEVEGPARPVREPPVTMARTVASAEATGIPEGTSIGKCSNCQVLLLAPKKRPLRLQCPRCERVHTLA